MRRLGSFRIKPGSRLLLRTARLRFLCSFVDSCDLSASKFSMFCPSFHCRRGSRPTVGVGLVICWPLGLGFLFFIFVFSHFDLLFLFPF
jgi:hypothetical protein